jgi:hypothetical protein
MTNDYTPTSAAVRLAAVAKLRTVGGVYNHIADFVQRDGGVNDLGEAPHE